MRRVTSRSDVCACEGRASTPLRAAGGYENPCTADVFGCSRRARSARPTAIKLRDARSADFQARQIHQGGVKDEALRIAHLRNSLCLDVILCLTRRSVTNRAEAGEAQSLKSQLRIPRSALSFSLPPRPRPGAPLGAWSARSQRVVGVWSAYCPRVLLVSSSPALSPTACLAPLTTHSPPFGRPSARPSPSAHCHRVS